MNSIKTFINIQKNIDIFNNINIHPFLDENNMNEIDFSYVDEKGFSKTVKYKNIDGKIFFYPVKELSNNNQWLKLFTSNNLNNNTKLGICIRETHKKKFLKKYEKNQSKLIIDILYNIFNDLIEDKRVGFTKIKNNNNNKQSLKKQKERMLKKRIR